MKKIVAFIAVLIYMTCTGTVWGQIADGTYYMRNRQTGKFLTGGNNWGTQASLHGTGMDFELKVSEGKYTINSKIGTNSKTYLYPNGDAGFLDGEATKFVFDNVEGNFYAISVDGATRFFAANGADTRANFTGNDKNSHYAQWELLTKQNLIDGLNAASMDNPMNATFFISGFDFNRNDNGRNGAWQGSPVLGGYEDYRRCAEKYSVNFDVYQELTGLPNGLYKLSVQGFYRAGGQRVTSTARNAVLYAGDSTTPLMNINEDIIDTTIVNTEGFIKVENLGNVPVPNGMTSACNAFVAGLYDDNSVFVNVTNGTLRIGIRKETLVENDWTCFDNFQLTYYGSNATINNAYTGSGTFYLQNVATGEYLQGGGMDGLQTMLGNGTEFELVKKYDGIYNIRNVGINPNGNDYLCDEGRLDHQPVDFIITDAGGGVYNIATLPQHCLKDDKYSQDGAANRLLTAVKSATSLETKDLNEFTFCKWSQANSGGSYTKAEEYSWTVHSYTSGNTYASQSLVYGDSNVDALYYTDLSGYSSITIKGTEGSTLRFLFNREAGNGSYKEVIFEIGESGRHTIDLTDYEYVHLNAIKVPSGSATIESITLNRLPVKTTDLKNIQFRAWSQAAPGGTSTTTEYANEIGGNALGKGGTFFGDGNVKYLKYADLTGYKFMIIRGTPNAYIQLRINREDEDTQNYVGATENVTIGSDGYAIVDLSKYRTYIHLHSVKHAWESTLSAATIESITLSRGQDVVAFAANANTWDGKSQWRFVTETQRINELTGASRTNPKDATFLIKNASLTEIDNVPNSAEESPFWVRPNPDNYHWYYIQRDEAAHTDGAGGIVKSYRNSDVYQIIANIPNGLYEVSMQGCYRHFDDAVFYANTISVPLEQAGSEFNKCMEGNHDNCTCRKVASVQTYGTNNYKKTLRIIVEDGTLRIGVRGNRNNDNQNFLIFDNFTLSYMGEATVTTYYMRNVATGDFVRAGGHYEAQAIRDDWGLALDFITFGGNTSLCYIDSRISNGGTNRYLGTNGFLDSPETEFTLENLGNNRYAIRTTDGKYLATADGDDREVHFDRGIQSGDTHAQWELLTRDQLIQELGNSGASDSNPKDATFLIEGSNFGRHDLRNNNTNWSGINFNDGKYGGVESLDWNSPDNYANFAVEKYNENFDTYQTISGLPAGTYELTVQGYYRSGNTATAADKTNDGTDILRPFLYVKQEGKLIGQAPLQSVFDGGVPNQTDGFSTSANGEWLPNSLPDAAKVFRDGHYMPNGEYNKVRFVVPSDGATVRIGVKKNIHYGSDWTAFDNFRLTYLGYTGETQTVYEHEIGTTLGTFYLKNAQTGTYLTAGGTDGVSAVLGDQMHQHSVYNNETKYQKGVRETDFTIFAVGADKFVIETGIGDGYLTRDNGVKLNGKPEPSKAFLTLRKNDNGNYYIFHNSDAERFLRYANNELYWGTSQSTTPRENFQWTFQTKDELLAEFPTATVDNPIDATFLLRGTAFHKDDSRNSAWTGKPEVGGAESNYVGSASGRTYNISQTLTDLPAGVYEFTLQGYHTNENGINEQARYYVSTDVLQRTLITKNTSGATTFINARNYAALETRNVVWEQDFTILGGNVDVSFRDNSFTVNGGATTIKPITINGTTISDNLGLEETTSDKRTYWRYYNKALYSQSGGPRLIGFRNLVKDQIIRIKTNDGTAFGVKDTDVLNLVYTTTDEVVLRVLKNGAAGIEVQRYTYIYHIGVYNELSATSVNVSDASTASSQFADVADKGVHPVIRFKVPDDERKMVTLGVFDAIKDADALYLDNVRLTYLGTSVTEGIATPQKLIRGIHHKRSRYYELAAENGHLTFDDYNTVNEASNKTTLSNETMVAHEHVVGRMIQHAPVYRDTIYARAGETLNIVLPSSYSDLAQSSGKYYQRLYNYKTDDMFVEDAANVGKFDLAGSNQGTAYSDADIRETMEVYEGSMSASAGGWVFGSRWGRQLVSRFNFTTPTDGGKFSNLDHAIEIAVDYTDLPDVGDMDMFGDLTEPTLVQRAVFVIVPSQVMADKLNTCTDDKFLEVKSISFPTIWYGLNTNDLNAVALDMQVRNYFSADADVTLDDLVITLTGNGTGITLDGGTTQADGTQTKTFASLDDRFIKFKYPDGGTVTNLVTEHIYVKTTSGRNIAKFILDFVPNTELRPWKDIMGQATLSRSPMYLDNHAQLIDVLNFDKSYRKEGGEAVYHPDTWPIGDETSINGIERDTVVKNPSQFNPYPLDFDQTTFGAYYPRAIWSQYSVMKRLHSYRDKPEFKDVNQLYHDYFSTQDGTGDLLQKYQGGGYFMYIDASNFPSSVARLTMEEKLCEGTTIHFSGWVSSMDLSTDSHNSPGYLLFSIVGIDARGNETVIESFCPGPIRADGKSYAGETVKYDTYHTEIGWTDSYSIWQQFAFSFVIKDDVASKYEEYALKIDNYCSNTSGGDMMVDDVRLYIHKAVPDVMQSVPVCSPGDMSGVEIYTDFDQLLSAVNMPEATSEQEAYNGYENKQAGGKIIPTAWYCFLDKKTYDDGIAALAGKNPTTTDYDAVFNNALVTTGGGTGYHSFTFSTCYESNNGGSNAYTHQYGDSKKQIVAYHAQGNTIGSERRIYINPTDCAVSLNELPYMVNSDTSNGTGTWSESDNVVWNVGKDNNNTIYGNENGTKVRYVDLEGYEELRIYQTAGDPVRCLFFNNDNTVSTNLTVSDSITNDRPMKFTPKKDEAGVSYWSVDLNAVKKLTGEVKLIAIKASQFNTSASVTAINVVRKSVELEPSKDYYIVFKAYRGETGVTSVGGPSTFFDLTSTDECAAMSEFRLVPNSMARFDGTLDSEGGDKYCAGQIATLKMEMQGFDSNNMAITLEDLPYDWWIGDKGEFMTKADDAPASPNDVLYAFRDEYPEATTYEDQEAKRTFTPEYKNALEQWIEKGKLYLYKTSQNVRVENTGSDGQMEIMVSPILSFLEGLTSFQYCDPIEVYINVSGSAPTVKDGFVGTTYPMDEVPLRIGLAQIQSVKDETADSWLEANNALYVPLRDINFSGETGYNKGFGKKKHNWGTDSSNALDIAAVYLTETDDPAMVSYGADVDSVGNRELRYVGKVHVFQAALGKGKFEDYVKLTFNPEFANNAKEGYRYVLKTSFEETNESGAANPCHGDLLIPLYIVPEYQVWAGGADGNWANDANWRRADNEELKFAATTDRPTNEANTTSQGFVPMDFTKVLMKSDSVAVLKDELGTDATTDIQLHLAAKEKGANADTWIPSELKGTDIYCVSFYNNTAKEVHFEPHSQMLNTQYLTYGQAWVEYALESDRWYTLSSPLQGVVSGDMYLPRGTAKQETPYFDPITYNNTDYSRLEPAVYQQAWDKAEATLYRLERDQLDNYRLPDWERNTATANVAQAFDWSYEYNDVKVPFGVNGFSVKVDVSRIEDYSKEEGVKDVQLRLPKDDKTYRYYMYDDEHNGSQTVDLTTTVVNGKNLRENAGKLFTDGMPAAGMTVTLTNNSTDNPYFLVGNPFMSGLDLDKFFEKNARLDKKYWILTKDSYSAGVKDETQNWVSTSDNTATDAVAPLQAFFVKKSDGTGGTLNVTFTSEMAVQLTGDALQTRAGGAPATLRLTAMRDGVESRAIVVCSEEATEGFCAGEDVEALFDSNLSHAPTLYTAAGEVAAAINVRRTLHGVPVGIGGEDETEVTLTFDGVEQFGEELYLYDAAEGTSTLIPASGTSLSVCGRTTGRYYLVTTPLDGSAQESAPVVSVQGRVVTVLSAFDEIEAVEAFDAMGCRVYADGAVGNRTRFALPAQGVYLITVKTAAGVFCHKVLVNS